MQKWKRLAPVSLPAKQPVAQLVIDLPRAEAALFQPCNDVCFELGGGSAVELARIDRLTLAHKSFVKKGGLVSINGLGNLEGIALVFFPNPAGAGSDPSCQN